MRKQSRSEPSTAITDTPEKEAVFPRCSELETTDSSNDDHDDLSQMFLLSDTDVGETFTSSSSSDIENETNMDVSVRDFVIANMHFCNVETIQEIL